MQTDDRSGPGLSSESLRALKRFSDSVRLPDGYLDAVRTLQATTAQVRAFDSVRVSDSATASPSDPVAAVPATADAFEATGAALASLHADQVVSRDALLALVEGAAAADRRAVQMQRLTVAALVLAAVAIVVTVVIAILTG